MYDYGHLQLVGKTYLPAEPFPLDVAVGKVIMIIKTYLTYRHDFAPSRYLADHLQLRLVHILRVVRMTSCRRVAPWIFFGLFRRQQRARRIETHVHDIVQRRHLYRFDPCLPCLRRQLPVIKMRM